MCLFGNVLLVSRDTMEQRVLAERINKVSNSSESATPLIYEPFFQTSAIR